MSAQPAVRVRVLGVDDAELWDRTVRRFRDVVTDPVPFLADPSTVPVVATGPADALAGWAWGLRQRHAAGYTQIQLYEIEVEATWRRHGVGRALLREFLSLARREGQRRLWLFTDEDNHAATGLYESLGGLPSPHRDAGYWWQLDPSA
jgi:ribosomal protein S18 acetylase RimI-like enzyme